jgi:hypothetical protein
VRADDGDGAEGGDDGVVRLAGRLRVQGLAEAVVVGVFVLVLVIVVIVVLVESVWCL